MGIELNNEQILTVYKCENWFRHSSQQVFEIAGAAGTGKAQPVFTKIPTPNGPKNLGDLKVGDYVFNKYGKPVKILGIYDQGFLNTYKVTLTDGRSTLCNNEHLWTVTYNGKTKTMTLQEIIDITNTSDTFQNFYVPGCGCVEYSTKDFDVFPYVAGMSIGDTPILYKYAYGDVSQRVEFIRGVMNSTLYDISINVINPDCQYITIENFSKTNIQIINEWVLHLMQC